MLRTVFLVLALSACSFDHGVAPGGDGGRGDPDAPSGDGMPGEGGSSARVRMLDIDDARVIGGPHTDFPVLVAITAPWLRAAGSGGSVARADGFDIHFSSDQSGTMPLAHEIEVYAPMTGTLVAWVKLPALAATSVLYLHYGDPALTTDPQNVHAVWSNSFEAVLHLGSVTDSAGKNTQLSSATSGAAAGAIDTALAFDGAENNLDIGSAVAIDNLFAAGGTAGAWFYAETWGEQLHGRIFDKGHVSGWSLWVNNDERAASVGFLHGTTSGGWGYWNTAANTVSLNAWHHVAVIFNKDSAANDPVFYVDGSLVTSALLDTPNAGMVSDASQGLRAGNSPGLDRAFDGMLDELRLSSVARSAGWIATEVKNQIEPAAFFSIGPEL